MSRRMLRPLAVAAAMVGALAAATAGLSGAVLAQSGDECLRLTWVVTGQDENGNPTYGWRLVDHCSTGGGDGSGGGGASSCEHPARGAVPCVHPTYGWWSHAESCWVQISSPQPSADEDVWGDNDPSEGAIYTFACPQDANTESVYEQFLSEAPDAPSVYDIARQAMDSLPLAYPDIGIAPDPDGVGLVGMHVWLWLDNADAAWGPVSISVPGPGITVTARGEVAQVEWNMGDDTTVVCDEPGVPYQASYGAEEPECGHVYSYPSLNQPEGRYHITATTVWNVEWWVEPQGSGESGGEPFERQDFTSVQINELQVVTS